MFRFCCFNKLGGPLCGCGVYRRAPDFGKLRFVALSWPCGRPYAKAAFIQIVEPHTTPSRAPGVIRRLFGPRFELGVYGWG